MEMSKEDRHDHREVRSAGSPLVYPRLEIWGKDIHAENALFRRSV